MPIIGNGNNALHELARAMAASGRRSAATALRKLAYQGYSSLEEVDQVPDWVLLSIRGIGMGRLTELRRLSRPDWQPPSPQALQAGVWFLSAVRFALRYWPPETLASLFRGSGSVPFSGESADKRLALDVFAHAAEHAQRYCKAEELIEAMWQTAGVEPHDTDLAYASSTASTERAEEPETGWSETQSPVPAFIAPLDGDKDQENDHFAHPRPKRIEIVRKYWLAREKREIQNKDAWARSHFQITGKTLLSYEREFEEHREVILAAADGK
ncbi:MAG: hypothetical protein JXM73_21630 [Anaerolineae bacterium]|nr:hypothetical protein [Anaerolineae bacterium]